MDFSLKEKTAIVVGGSKGLGFGMATGLAQAGANVVLVSRNQGQLDDAAAKISQETGNENVVGFATDITSVENINGLIAKVCDKFGQVDILFNGAGVNKRFSALEFTEADWDIVQDTQLKYVFFMCQAVAKQMVEKGIKGKIINIASLTSRLGLPNMISYCAAKGAIVQITKAMANEWAQYGINVNAIGPGYYETEMTAPLFADEKRRAELFARIPQKKFGLPSDLAGAAVFLASEASVAIWGLLQVRRRVSSSNCTFVERLRLTACMANSTSRLTKGSITLLMSSTSTNRLTKSVTSTELTHSQIRRPRREGACIHLLYAFCMRTSLPFSCFFDTLAVIISVKESLDKELISCEKKTHGYFYSFLLPADSLFHRIKG